MRKLRPKTDKRSNERGFTLIEAVLVVAIGSLTVSAFFGLQYAIQHQSRYVTDGILTRRNSQEAVRVINRELTKVTQITHDPVSDPNRVIILQDFNIPRTPDTTTDDMSGEIVFDPSAHTLSIIDDTDNPNPRMLARDIQDLTIGVAGNTITFEMEVRPTNLSDTSILRTAFTLRNLPH